jgi:hypothetical protein
MRRRRRLSEVGGDDDVVRAVEVRVGLVADIAGDDVDFDAWVELLDLGSSGFGALCELACDHCTETGVRIAYVLAHIRIAYEELRAQILFGDDFVVCERDGADAG